MPEYTLLTLLAVPAVVAVELLWLRTGVFRKLQYWLAMAIVMFFQVLVDGWLTKLSDPIVLYNPEHHAGIRFPWDIPVEDFGFGWAMVTLVIVVWVHLGRREAK
ncbi:lycopene cyclase domain-containing protein [Tessaracoccus terricola]